MLACTVPYLFPFSEILTRSRLNDEGRRSTFEKSVPGRNALTCRIARVFLPAIAWHAASWVMDMLHASMPCDCITSIISAKLKWAAFVGRRRIKQRGRVINTRALIVVEIGQFEAKKTFHLQITSKGPNNQTTLAST